MTAHSEHDYPQRPPAFRRLENGRIPSAPRPRAKTVTVDPEQCRMAAIWRALAENHRARLKSFRLRPEDEAVALLEVERCEAAAKAYEQAAIQDDNQNHR